MLVGGGERETAVDNVDNAAVAGVVVSFSGIHVRFGVVVSALLRCVLII